MKIGNYEEFIETSLINHPFYTADGEWVMAGDLETGDRILALDGSYGTVETLVVVERVQAMYDLTVAEAPTFAVGAGQWVVHNACDWSPQMAKGGKEVRYDAAQNAQRHFDRHGSEFPELGSVEDYINAANDFIKNPPPNTQTRVGSRTGDTFMWDPDSNTLVIVDTGTNLPRTMYQVNPKSDLHPRGHNFSTNQDYFDFLE